MPIRLLVVSDGVVPTGLARVVHSILRRLPPEEYDIHHLAVNYRGDPHDTPWKVYPAGAGGDVYGFKRIGELVKGINPQVIFIFNDPWIECQYLEILKGVWHSARIVMWMLVESDGFDPEWVKDVAIIERLVVCTPFAKEQILQSLPEPVRRTRQVDIIPLGVDRSKFYPLSPLHSSQRRNGTDAAKAQLQLLPPDTISESFIVLNANRNQPRKRIDITLKAFSLFATGKPANVKLYLHMGVQDAGWNILKLAKRFGIDERLIVSSSGGVVPAVGDEDLNLIYNACDIGLNTSACEGWGLVAFEHAAAGKAQIVPDIPSLRGLWEGSAVLAPVNRVMVNEQTLLNGYLVDEMRLAAILEQLYSDVDARARVSETCLANAMREEYSWDSVAKRWDGVFKSVAK